MAVFRKSRLRQCRWCKTTFKSNFRLKERQQTCGSPICRRQHRKVYQRKYRQINRGIEIEYQDKRKKSLPSGYWKAYRALHPESSERNLLASKLRKALKREGLQRKLDITQVADESGYFREFCEFATTHRCLIKENLGKPAA